MICSRDFMISSICGYSQLNLYSNSEFLKLDDLIPNKDILFELNNLSIEHQKILLYTYYILNPSTQKFISYLKKYRSDIYISSKKYQESHYGTVKGNINWTLTIKERLGSGGLFNPLFVCNPTKKQFDIPENILLKYYLIKLKGLITYILKKSNDVKNNDSWIKILKSSLSEINSTLNISVLSTVSNVNKINFSTVKNLRHSKKTHYKTLLDSYLLYDKIFIKKDDISIKLLLLENSLISLDNDKLYEIYILFNIFKSLDKHTNIKSFSLLGHNKSNEPIASYTFNEGTLEIRFQTLPYNFKENSEYVRFMNACKLNDTKSQTPRVPDLFLSWIPKCNTYQHDLFIELKHSCEQDYFGKSVYKAFGYIYDYSNSLTHSPKGILVFDGDIKPSDSDDLFICKTSDFNIKLEKLLSNWGIIT